MKKIFFLGLLSLALIYSFTSINSSVSCDRSTLTANCKKKMQPFKYDSQKFTKIIHKNKSQQLEIEVPVFFGEKYRLVFNTKAVSKPIAINVYTKDKESQKREAIYSTKSSKTGESEFVFDAPLIRKLFIDYEIPADSSNSNLSECVVFMIGYDLIYK